MATDPNNQSTTHNLIGKFMVAAGAIITYRNTGNILLLQRNSTLDWQHEEWEIPYGRLNQFEDVETGLTREIQEETGITTLSILSILRVWHIFRGSKKPENELIGITYSCNTNSDTIQLSDEHTSYAWVTPDEALSRVHVPGIRDDILKFKQTIAK